MQLWSWYWRWPDIVGVGLSQISRIWHQACQLDLDHCTEFTPVCTTSQLCTTFPSPSLPAILIILLLLASVFLSQHPPYFLVNHVIAPIDQIYKFSTPLFTSTSALWNLMQWSSGRLMTPGTLKLLFVEQNLKIGAPFRRCNFME